MNSHRKKFEKTTLFTPNVWQSQLPVQMFPLMPAARVRERETSFCSEGHNSQAPAKASKFGCLSITLSHMLMESESSTFGIIWLFVCEKQLALTGGRSSSFKHFNTEILALPITLEGVFALRGREKKILEDLQVKNNTTLSVFTKPSITIIIISQQLRFGLLNKFNLAVVPHSYKRISISIIQIMYYCNFY